MIKNSIEQILKTGGIGVLATDTIYGLVGSALDEKAVKRVYKTRKRNPNKPCIILISSIKDLAKFGINLNKETEKILNKVWAGRRATSIILPCSNLKFKYLHRGTNTLAFRLPKNTKRNKNLINLMKKTGPLIAPSANPEGLPPANTITKARAYFVDQVDFYVAGRTTKKPSRLIKIDDCKLVVLRK